MQKNIFSEISAESFLRRCEEKFFAFKMQKNFHTRCEIFLEGFINKLVMNNLYTNYFRFILCQQIFLLLIKNTFH